MGAGSDTDHIRVWRRHLAKDSDAKLNQVSSTYSSPVILEVRLLAVGSPIKLKISVIDSQPDTSNTNIPNIWKEILDRSLSTAGFLVSDIPTRFAGGLPELLKKFLPSSVRLFREYIVQIICGEILFKCGFGRYNPVRILFRAFDQPREVRV